jgi:class 3 adenylate cyclase
MTGQQTLTYMATDIIGYSVLTQKDQHKAFELLETYQSILIPLIEKEGGSTIVCTADAITACFSSCQSAIRAGFAIQKALTDWNRSSTTSKLATRIGIHASRPDDKGHFQQLSKTVAASLESLGNAKALSVSLPVLKGPEDEASLHYFPLGGRDLDYLPDPLKVFYLYEEKPGFFTRLGLQLNYLKSEYTARFTHSYSFAAITGLVLFMSVFLFNTPATYARNIEFSEVINLSRDGYDGDARKLSRLIKDRLIDTSRVTVLKSTGLQQAASRLVCSFQRSGENVRLTWGFLDQNGEVQTSGGEVSGKIENIKKLETRFLNNITSQIEISNS